MGIPRDKLRIIFEAFQQGEGGTSRKYGGTGLGLSISREIARLLGGELDVSSKAGEGSEFTLYLPLEYVPVEEPASQSIVEVSEPPVVAGDGDGDGDGNGHGPQMPTRRAELDWSLLEPGDVDDDRSMIVPGDRVVLVVSPDAERTGATVEAIRARGSKALAALRDEAGLALAHEFIPDAIVLTVDGDSRPGHPRAGAPQAPSRDPPHPGLRGGRPQPPPGAAVRGRRGLRGGSRDAGGARRRAGGARGDGRAPRPAPAGGRGRRRPAREASST